VIHARWKQTVIAAKRDEAQPVLKRHANTSPARPRVAPARPNSSWTEVDENALVHRGKWFVTPV
jgi:hypothetical protein